jgi:hypothetical protein
MVRSKSTNYTRNKSLFGGVPGTIQIHTVPGIGVNNDPNTAKFKDDLPGGFLKCDGSVHNAKDYYLLAQILGIGSECRFKKEKTNLRDPDPETGDLGSFQLPDLGSKVIIPSGGSGDYTNVFMENKPNTTKVGVETQAIIEGEENRIFVNYTSGSASNNGIATWSGYNGSVGGGGAITGFVMRQVTDVDGSNLEGGSTWSGDEFGDYGYRNAGSWWTNEFENITGDFKIKNNTDGARLTGGLGAVMNITIEPNKRPNGDINRSKIRINAYVNGQRGTGYDVDDECSVVEWDNLAGTGNRIFKVTEVSPAIESEGYKTGTTDAWFYNNVGTVRWDDVGSENDYWEDDRDYVEENFQMQGGSGAGAVFKIRMQGDDGGRTKWKILAIVNPGEGYQAGDKLSWNFNTPWRIANGHTGSLSLEDDNGEGVVRVDGTSFGVLQAGMEVEGSSTDIQFNGSLRYNMIRETEGYVLTIDEFQAHSHSCDVSVLNYTGNYDTSGDGMTGSTTNAFSANSSGYNAIEETTINVPIGEANHSHRLQRPTAYNQNFVYNYQPFNVSTDNMQSYIDVDVERVEVLNQVVTPFIMVHYIIKF